MYLFFCTSVTIPVHTVGDVRADLQTTHDNSAVKRRKTWYKTYKPTRSAKWRSRPKPLKRGLRLAVYWWWLMMISFTYCVTRYNVLNKYIKHEGYRSALICILHWLHNGTYVFHQCKARNMPIQGKLVNKHYCMHLH